MDKIQIEQVLLNLIRNAMDAMRDQEERKLTVQTALGEPGFVLVSVTDNGSGIRQADRAKPQSFGLRGMAERANALGGTLTLSHASGGGTVVAIKIKVSTPRENIIAAAAASTGASTAAKGGRSGR